MCNHKAVGDLGTRLCLPYLDMWRGAYCARGDFEPKYLFKYLRKRPKL